MIVTNPQEQGQKKQRNSKYITRKNISLTRSAVQRQDKVIGQKTSEMCEKCSQNAMSQSATRGKNSMTHWTTCTIDEVAHVTQHSSTDPISPPEHRLGTSHVSRFRFSTNKKKQQKKRNRRHRSTHPTRGCLHGGTKILALGRS